MARENAGAVIRYKDLTNGYLSLLYHYHDWKSARTIAAYPVRKAGCTR